jgi:hypothetical protein
MASTGARSSSSSSGGGDGGGGGGGAGEGAASAAGLGASAAAGDTVVADGGVLLARCPYCLLAPTYVSKDALSEHIREVHKVGHLLLELVQQREIGAAAPASTLVPEDGPRAVGIKKLAVPRHGPAARATMHKHHRKACGVAALLEIHHVAVLLGQEAVRVGLNGGKQGVWRGGWHGLHAMPFWRNAGLRPSA